MISLLKTLRIVICVLLVPAVTACTTAKPVGEWRDDNFSSQIDNILIINITSRSTRQRFFEERFVAALATLKIEAIPSYQLLTSTQQLSRETVVAAIKRKKLEAVLITRLVGIKQEQAYRLPVDIDYYRSYFDYYDHALQENNSGYYAQYKILALETNLYDTASGTLVWSMQSKTMAASQPRHKIEEQINLTIDTLKQRGLLAVKS